MKLTPETLAALPEHERTELEKFARYIAACARWEKANDDLPDFAPISDLERAAYEKKKIKAQFAIYEQIYGEKP